MISNKRCTNVYQKTIVTVKRTKIDNNIVDTALYSISIACV